MNKLRTGWVLLMLKMRLVCIMTWPCRPPCGGRWRSRAGQPALAAAYGHRHANLGVPGRCGAARCGVCVRPNERCPMPCSHPKSWPHCAMRDWQPWSQLTSMVLAGYLRIPQQRPSHAIVCLYFNAHEQRPEQRPIAVGPQTSLHIACTTSQ